MNVHMIISCRFLVSFESSVDGFTFQGADVQIGTHAERAQGMRISNCVFDMRNGGTDNTIGPDFGILLVPIWDARETEQLYNPLSYKIFNNTFIQGFRKDEGGAEELAKSWSVGICNVGDPASSFTLSDPLPLHGPSELSIQNNLFRCLPNKKRTSLLGIDSGDTSIAPGGGSRSGPTNAFGIGTVGGTNPKYESAIFGPPATPPTPRVNINQGGSGVDPGFIGEMISQLQASTLINKPLLDWRLLPDSALVDQGSGPLYSGSNGIFTATNGLSYNDNPTSPISSFDFDGDGHGSPRWVGSHPDIGFDETDLFVVAGCYGNGSKSHETPFETQVLPGNPDRTLIFPGPGTAHLWFTLVQYDPGLIPAWTISPGTTPGDPGAAGINYLDPITAKSVALPSPTTTVWTNPVDNNTHTWAQTILNWPDVGTVESHFNQQVLFRPTGSSSVFVSNLQFEIY